MAGLTAGATLVRGQVPAPSSTPAPTSASSSLRPILRHSDSDSRSSPETSFTQDNSRLCASTSAQPSLRHNRHIQSVHHGYLTRSLPLEDDALTERQSTQMIESDQEVDSCPKSSAGKKEVVEAGEEEVEESFLAHKEGEITAVRSAGRSSQAQQIENSDEHA
ncbi:hypothetical protein BYT27DRAFT_7207927 [Phlegmacium glaucopus]|nr:hypothetical protein BYT27DRAFT_7207927 [Phlegmacium glaucopus]